MDNADRVFEAAISRFAAGGMRAVSIREVARAAGLMPSAVPYRYGAKADLWNSALDWAIDRDIARLRQFEKTIRSIVHDRPLTLDEGMALVRLYIFDSLTEHRDTTITWQAMLVGGLRHRAPWPCGRNWLARRTEVWGDLTQHLGMDAKGAADALVVATTTIELFLLVIADDVERALYCDDFVRFVFSRLRSVEPPAAMGEWFLAWCHTRTDERFEPGRSDDAAISPARTLSNAVARLLLVHGAEGVTHRAIAAEAGVSLATTTRHFSSLQDLLRAGYDRIGVNMFRNLLIPGRRYDSTDISLSASWLSNAVRRGLPLADLPDIHAAAIGIVVTWLSDDARQGLALAGLTDVHIAAVRDPALLETASAIIAKLTILTASYFTNDNPLGLRTSFEAHMLYALFQSRILIAALDGTEPEALIQRSMISVEQLLTLLFPRQPPDAPPEFQNKA